MRLLNALWVGVLSLGLMLPGSLLAYVPKPTPAASGPVVNDGSRTPTAVLTDVSNQLIARLKKDKEPIRKDPFVIIDIVDTIIMPITDFELIAKRVLGTHWPSATEAEQKKFLKEFKLLLIVTYIAAFRSYDNQSVAFKREIVDPDDPTRVEVQTNIQEPGAPPIPVNYRVHKVQVKDPKTGANVSRWLVYDFNVEGVGLTNNFRKQFNQAIETKGVDQMLEDMHKKNEDFFGRE